MHLQSYVFKVCRNVYMSSAQIHYLRLMLSDNIQWMSPVLIFKKFVKGCRWWYMTDGLMDTHEIHIRTFFNFINNMQKSANCHILTLILHEDKSWSMPQLPDINLLTNHELFVFYVFLLICVHMRRNSLLWMKILVNDLLSHLDKIWYCWVCTVGIPYSIIPT
jgi:hypothetical protein